MLRIWLLAHPRHYSVTTVSLVVCCMWIGQKLLPLIIFILVVWNFSICLIEPIRFLGCTSVPVPMYQCISISTYQYNASAQCTWHLAYQVQPRPYQALPTRPLAGPTRPHQALPGPTRTYQTLPGLGLPKDHTLDHILFWQPPKTPPKQHTFFDTHLKKQKHTFYTVKCMFSLKSPKIGKKCIKILPSNSWPSKNIHFTV